MLRSTCSRSAPDIGRVNGSSETIFGSESPLRSVDEIEEALRADGEEAVARIQQRCGEVGADLEQWSRFTLAVAEALARVGIEEDFVWALLNRLGPQSPFEEEWRTARFRILTELALWEGSSKDELRLHDHAVSRLAVTVSPASASRHAGRQL